MRTVLLTTTLAFLLPHSASAGPKTDPWIKNYDQARAIARKTGKPMFVVFR